MNYCNKIMSYIYKNNKVLKTNRIHTRTLCKNHNTFVIILSNKYILSNMKFAKIIDLTNSFC